MSIKLTKLGQQGFTMIELIMVIVILAILSVVAIPKFMDMRTEAAKSAAEGVFAASQSAAVINHAAVMMGKAATTPPTTPAYHATNCAGGLIIDGLCLLSAMEGTPEGWSASGATITNGTYTITVTPQTSAIKAVLTKSWTN